MTYLPDSQRFRSTSRQRGEQNGQGFRVFFRGGLGRIPGSACRTRLARIPIVPLGGISWHSTSRSGSEKPLRSASQRDDIQAYIGSGEWRGQSRRHAVQGIAGSSWSDGRLLTPTSSACRLYECVTLLGGEVFRSASGWLNAS